MRKIVVRSLHLERSVPDDRKYLGKEEKQTLIFSFKHTCSKVHRTRHTLNLCLILSFHRRGRTSVRTAKLTLCCCSPQDGFSQCWQNLQICKRALFFTHSRHLIREGCNHFPIKKYHLSAFRSLRKWILLCRFSGFLITEVFPYMIPWTARALPLTTDVQLRIATILLWCHKSQAGGVIIVNFFYQLCVFQNKGREQHTRPQVPHPTWLFVFRQASCKHSLQKVEHLCLSFQTSISKIRPIEKPLYTTNTMPMFLIFSFHVIQI